MIKFYIIEFFLILFVFITLYILLSSNRKEFQNVFYLKYLTYWSVFFLLTFFISQYFWVTFYYDELDLFFSLLGFLVIIEMFVILSTRHRISFVLSKIIVIPLIFLSLLISTFWFFGLMMAFGWEVEVLYEDWFYFKTQYVWWAHTNKDLKITRKVKKKWFLEKLISKEEECIWVACQFDS